MMIKMDDKKRRKLESLIAKLMQSSKIPSIALSIVQDGKEIYSRAFGSKLLKENAPATTNTIYGIGSVSKSFTCVAIMQLVEKGKIKLDDPINKYLDFQLGLEGKPITIKHLMSHSSGIPNLGVANVLISRYSNLKETYVPMSNKEDLIQFINEAQEEIIDEPGKRFFYFNAGFVLLGMLIEKISGKKYHEYIKENIFQPLEMETACFTREEFEKVEDRMTAYKTDKDELIETIHPFDEFIYAAGGIICSVNELKNYLLMNLNDGKFKEKQVLSKKSLEQMFTPIIESNLGTLEKMNYGFGWAIEDGFFDETVIAHGGSTAVSSAYVSLMPSKKIGIALAANCGNSQGSLITKTIMALLLDKDPMKDLPPLILDNKLNVVAGKYKSYKGLAEIEIIKKGSMLFAKQVDKDTIDYQIVPRNNKPDNFEFYVPTGISEYPVEFLVDIEKGKVTFLFERNAYHKKS